MLSPASVSIPAALVAGGVLLRAPVSDAFVLAVALEVPLGLARILTLEGLGKVAGSALEAGYRARIRAGMLGYHLLLGGLLFAEAGAAGAGLALALLLSRARPGPGEPARAVLEVAVLGGALAVATLAGGGAARVLLAGAVGLGTRAALASVGPRSR